MDTIQVQEKKMQIQILFANQVNQSDPQVAQLDDLCYSYFDICIDHLHILHIPDNKEIQYCAKATVWSASSWGTLTPN